MNSLSTLLNVIKSHNSILNQHKNFILFDLAYIVSYILILCSQCTKSCGGGIKTRQVQCKQVMAQNHIVNRPESQCPTIKPQDRRPCNTKQCAHDDLNPAIAVANVTYTQTNPSKKKVNLKIGGQAQVFYGTQVKIKCPVRRFNRLV